MDFFRLHFSVQVKIGSFSLELDWNEVAHSILVQQFPKMISVSLTNFGVDHTHVTTIVSQVEVLFVLCT